MANLVKRCVATLLSSAHGLNHLSTYHNRASQIAIRAIFTSPVLENQTNEPNKQHPFFWPIEDFLDLKVEEKEKETYVEAIPISTGREGRVLNVESKTACALCRLNLKGFNYTDVMILSQFIKRDGSMATLEESKLCPRQYMQVKRFIKQAQRCNLIRRPPDYLVPGAWHDLNTYLEKDRKRDQPYEDIRPKYWRL